MNIITKTGTNKWAGTVQFAGSNHSLESNNITDPKIKAQLLAGVPAFALAANRTSSWVEHAAAATLPSRWVAPS